MDNQNRKLELLGNAPIPKALLAMGIPTMIGMLINALYNLVDAYFVGGLGESQRQHQRACCRDNPYPPLSAQCCP